MKVNQFLVYIIFIILICFFARVLLAADATVSELKGKAWMKRDSHWQPLFPLQELQTGDLIKVERDGWAVISYLNVCQYAKIVPQTSPYRIVTKTVGKPLKKKLQELIKEILTIIIPSQIEISDSYVVRGKNCNRLHIKQPDYTYVLYKSGHLHFEWCGKESPYILKIYKVGDDDLRTKIYQRKVVETSYSLPIKKFEPGIEYIWEVYSSGRTATGHFKLMSLDDTNKIIHQLDEITHFIPKEMKGTNAITTYGYLFDKGFFYDAERIIREARKENPGDKVLEALFKLAHPDLSLKR